MKYIYLIILYFIPFLAFAQNENKPVSIKTFPAVSELEIRTFDEKQLEDYKLLDDFQYEEAEYEQSEFSKAWDRFWGKLFSLLGKSVSNKWVNRIVSAIILLLLFRYIIRMKSQNLMVRSDEKSKHYVEELDIRMKESTIQDKLNSAKEEERWREAVRYSYLLVLKKLNEKDKIRWKEWKLSQDYLKELKDESLIEGFEKLTHIFNFAWYGERTLDNFQFEEFEKSYREFMSKSELS